MKIKITRLAIIKREEKTKTKIHPSLSQYPILLLLYSIHPTSYGSQGGVFGSGFFYGEILYGNDIYHGFWG